MEGRRHWMDVSKAEFQIGREDIPCKSIAHTTTSSHDSSGGEQHTNQREAKSSQFASLMLWDQIVSYMRRQVAPALLWVAFFRIARRGPADELMMFSMSPATKRRTIKKMKPVTVPITTHAIIILGPSTEGLGISVMRQYCRSDVDYASAVIPSIMWATPS